MKTLLCVSGGDVWFFIRIVPVDDARTGKNGIKLVVFMY